MAVEYDCIHEEQIQSQSRKIEALEVKIDFKEQRINELNNKMDKLNDKFDEVIKGFNDLKLASKTDDTQLELRLKAIETELKLQKETSKNNHQKQQANYTKLATIGGLVSIGLVILDLFLKYGLK